MWSTWRSVVAGNKAPPCLFPEILLKIVHPSKRILSGWKSELFFRHSTLHSLRPTPAERIACWKVAEESLRYAAIKVAPERHTARMVPLRRSLALNTRWTGWRKSKRCLHHDCTKVPSYGVDGSKRVEFCSEHKTDGMVDLKPKRCLPHGCTQAPSFGMNGSKGVEFCSSTRRTEW